MQSCDSGFAKLLWPLAVETLNRHEGAIYGLWPDLTLAYLNPAWFQFAQENGSKPNFARRWGVGASIAPVLKGPLDSFYRNAFEGCLATGERWDHSYECTGAKRFRRFQMRVYPLGRGEGLLIANTQAVERVHSDQAFASGVIEQYRDKDGLAHMCVHCRRFRRFTLGNALVTWDWIAEWVARLPERVSHGLCPLCYEYHFPQSGRIRVVEE